jgi:RNA polymerase sigma-70 factor (ECF subfamily)
MSVAPAAAPRVCGVCGRPLPPRPPGPGRASRYCSAACRQRAYRERGAPPEQTVDEIIADIARRAQALAPDPVEALAAGADELGSRVARLRRMARTAADAARQNVTPPAVTETDGLAELDFAELAERHRRELRAHCYRLLGSYDEAEDLVQETFLRAWRARDGFARRASARTWLFRIATNACLDHLRALDSPRSPAAR